MMPTPDSEQSGETESETTGFPGLRTWRGIYLLVTIVFVVWVALLTALERIFS
jgi:hypothetical protein